MHQVQLDPNGWILKEVNYTTVGVDEVLPDKVSLLPAYPNPFNSGTTINFFIPQVLGEIDATLQVMDVNGRHISTLLSKQVSSGMKSFYWDASVDASGIYFIHLLAGNNIFNRKIILLK